jgi:hypothetical protein
VASIQMQKPVAEVAHARGVALPASGLERWVSHSTSEVYTKTRDFEYEIRHYHSVGFSSLRLAGYRSRQGEDAT